jgi:hypothetical protein
MSYLMRGVAIGAILAVTGCANLEYPGAERSSDGKVVLDKYGLPKQKSYESAEDSNDVDSHKFIMEARYIIQEARTRVEALRLGTDGGVLYGGVAALAGGLLHWPNHFVIRSTLIAGTSLAISSAAAPRDQMKILDVGLQSLSCLDDKRLSAEIAIDDYDISRTNAIQSVQFAKGNLEKVQYTAEEFKNVDHRAYTVLMADVEAQLSAANITINRQNSLQTRLKHRVFEQTRNGVITITDSLNSQLAKVEPDAAAISQAVGGIKISGLPTGKLSDPASAPKPNDTVPNPPPATTPALNSLEVTRKVKDLANILNKNNKDEKSPLALKLLDLNKDMKNSDPSSYLSIKPEAENQFSGMIIDDDLINKILKQAEDEKQQAQKAFEEYRKARLVDAKAAFKRINTAINDLHKAILSSAVPTAPAVAQISLGNCLDKANANIVPPMTIIPDQAIEITKAASGNSLPYSISITNGKFTGWAGTAPRNVQISAPSTDGATVTYSISATSDAEEGANFGIVLTPQNGQSPREIKLSVKAAPKPPAKAGQ